MLGHVKSHYLLETPVYPESTRPEMDSENDSGADNQQATCESRESSTTIRGREIMVNGAWVTGFADGESWFQARPLLRARLKKRGKVKKLDRAMEVSWHIQLRYDDKEVLEKIQDYFGFGAITFRGGRGRKGNPCAVFGCWGVDNCLRLIKHFDAFPLQSKKATDYKIWRRIVQLVAAKYHLKGGYKRVHALCWELRQNRIPKIESGLLGDKKRAAEMSAPIVSYKGNKPSLWAQRVTTK
jgi:hypothetical protein